MLIFLTQSLLCPLSLEEVIEHYLKTAPAKRKLSMLRGKGSEGRDGNKEEPRVVSGQKEVKTVVRKSPAVPFSSDSSGNTGQGSSIS